ncbi:MAG TPA: carboxypeptidase regulatory-like domain-containing protein [Pyrinomonadaceae bacterium]|jgi:tetratricopeptide (TPR) repeat protein|nr:carboxypeptidase regulatory-like domain-containing protein [Pyrinomonadaceae bacterium]
MRRHLLNILIAAAVLVCASVAAPAQTGALRGTVKLIAADGSTTPVAGATVDVYRVDITGEYHTKSDKKGEWVFAGLPFTGEYVVSVSAPGAQPTAKSGVKAGRDVPVDIVLNSGDGKKLTKDEAIGVSKGGGGGASNSGGGESAAAKAKREEELKKYEAEKNRITNINETLNRTFKAGQDAITAKNYDEAVKQFDEGLAADPEQVVMYSRKSLALRLRGVDHYNASIKGTDQTQKAADMENAKKDFQGAVDAANKGLEMANKETPATDPQAQAGQASKKLEVLSYRAEAMRLLVKTDPSQGGAALAAYQEYIAAETDATKKARAEKDVAQIMFDTASDQAGFEKALAAYQKILEANPDDPDALLRSGQILFNIGALNNNDKAKYQEAANYLQRFIEKAPEGNPMKAEAKDLIDALKAQANVTPEKTSTPPRRRRP